MRCELVRRAREDDGDVAERLVPALAFKRCTTSASRSGQSASQDAVAAAMRSARASVMQLTSLPQACVWRRL